MSATECLSHRWLHQRTPVQIANDSVTQTNNELDFQKDILRNIVDRWNGDSNGLSIAPGATEDKNNSLQFPIANGICAEKSKLPRSEVGKGLQKKPGSKKSKKSTKKASGEENAAKGVQKSNQKFKKSEGPAAELNGSVPTIPDKVPKSPSGTNVVENEGNSKISVKVERNRSATAQESKISGDSKNASSTALKSKISADFRRNKSNPTIPDDVSKSVVKKWSERTDDGSGGANTSPKVGTSEHVPEVQKESKISTKPPESNQTSKLDESNSAIPNNVSKLLNNDKKLIEPSGGTSVEIVTEEGLHLSNSKSKNIPVTKSANGEIGKSRARNEDNLKITNGFEGAEMKNNANCGATSPKFGPKVKKEKQDNSICNSVKSTRTKAVRVSENGLKADKTKISAAFDNDSRETKIDVDGVSRVTPLNPNLESYSRKSTQKPCNRNGRNLENDESTPSKSDQTLSKSTKKVEVEVDDGSYRCVKKRNVFIKNIVESYEQRSKKIQTEVRGTKEADSTTPAEAGPSEFQQLLDRPQPQLTHRRISDISSLLSSSDRLELDKSIEEMTAFCNNIHQIARLRSDSYTKTSEGETTSKRPKFRLSCFSRDVPTFISTPPYRTNFLNYLPWCGGGDDNPFSWTFKKSAAHHSDPGSLRNSPERATSPSLTRKILSKFFDNAEYNVADISTNPRNLAKDKLTEIFS